jgi:hypothetical protein
LCNPPLIENLTPRERRLLLLADHADAYVKQEQRRQQQTNRETHGRPDNFGDVDASRRDAFQ